MTHQEFIKLAASYLDKIVFNDIMSRTSKDPAYARNKKIWERRLTRLIEGNQK